MVRPADSLAGFLSHMDPMILVEIVSLSGSGPREKDALMLVSASGYAGTIGGGALEFGAIKEARAMLETDRNDARLVVNLGPDTGQCCGGRVELGLRLLDATKRTELENRIACEMDERPHLYIFGAGHVGHALAQATVRLPMVVHLVDSRPDALQNHPQGIDVSILAMPETFVAGAPACSAFAVMTHDHGLDFLIASEALKRGDAAYVGLIGSKTKKARFRREFVASGGTEKQFSRLVSPIGGAAIRDKRPAVIAALAAAEITRALLSARALLGQKRGEAA